MESLSSSGDSSVDSSKEALQPEDSNADYWNSIDNEYIRGILSTVDLQILQPCQVNNPFKSNNHELELFHLFMTKNYPDEVSKWMNEVLVDKGRRACSYKEFFAYIGLEHGMSLMKFNDIKKYWPGVAFWDMRLSVRQCYVLIFKTYIHAFIFHLNGCMTVMEPVVFLCGFADQ
jgi:hypothetical protein